MLKCHKCGKTIHLGFAEKEEQDFADELKLSKVIILCIECYDETHDAINRFSELTK